MFIKLGSNKIDDTLEVIYEKEKETEKAVQIKETRIEREYGKEFKEEDTAWLPKSQIKIINDEYIELPDWLLAKNRMWGFNIAVTLNFSELKEKTGLTLTKLTSEQRIDLLNQGLAKVEYR